MPTFAAHYMFGREVYKRLSADLKALIMKDDKSLAFYDVGAQGPDIFFFYPRPYKTKVSAYGVKLHHSAAYNLFDKAFENMKGQDEETQKELLVYLFGVCNHFTLDSCAHPLINKATKTFSEHMLLEAELDRLVIDRYFKNYRKQEYKYRRQNCLDATIKYGEYLHIVYPEISAKECQGAVRGTKLCMQGLYSPYFIKGAALKTLCKGFARGNDFSKMIIRKKTNHTFDDINFTIMADWAAYIELGVKNITNLYNFYLGKARLSEYFTKDFE